ncbi:MAG: hypothetical protein IPO28_15130 [Holophagaceae bacterium]|nr:hypothetical protein [Holophagaceae bacterium]
MAKDFNGSRKLLYVACSTTGVNKIMKIDLSGASPVVSLFAGAGAQGYADNAVATAGLLNGPSGVCVDDSGNVYIADSFNMAIRMVPVSGPLAGALITIAGKTGAPAAEGYAPSATTWDGTTTLPTSTIASLARPYYVAARGTGAAGTKLYGRRHGQHLHRAGHPRDHRVGSRRRPAHLDPGRCHQARGLRLRRWTQDRRRRH